MEKTNRKNRLMLLGEVLTDPGAAFKEIDERPRFWPAAIVLVLINLLFSIITLPKVRENAQYIIDKTLETLSPEQAELLAGTMSTGHVTATTMVAAVITPLLIWLIISLVLKLFAAVSAREAPFNKVFAVSVYGYVPTMISAVISAVLVLFTAVEKLQKVTISLAVFSTAESGFWHSFLSTCNPFTWWSLILWGMGIATVMKLKRPTGPIVYLFAIWLVFALIVGAFGTFNLPAL